MWFIRRMLRISWTEKKPNENVLREGNVQRSLLKTIRKRQMEFLGHVCRRRGLEFLSLTGKVEGKRDRGKQRISFLDSLCNSTTGGQSKGLNFFKLSDDRDVWRGMVANVCSRSGTWWWWYWTTYIIAVALAAVCNECGINSENEVCSFLGSTKGNNKDMCFTK